MALDTAGEPPPGPDAVRPLPSDAAAAPAPAAGGEPAEELDARYAPYARRDAYGVMGRGPLAPAEAARLALAAAVLLPLRLVVGMLVLLLYYLMGRVCKLFAGRGPALPRGVEKEGGS